MARQRNAKVSESYFLFPDGGVNAAYTITLKSEPMKHGAPTVVISVNGRVGEYSLTTIVHNSWTTIGQITNFYIPEFVTITSEDRIQSVIEFKASEEFGMANTPISQWRSFRVSGVDIAQAGDGWLAGRHHIHNFCKGFKTINRFISEDFKKWQDVLCPKPAGASPKHTPNKSDIASGALQDIGVRGFSFTGSPARFYARWGNKEKRKQAGFSYNFDTFALRTDYNKLPAAQDSGVMLDTYRVGIMPDIGKRHRLFAGVDNYRNGILAIQYTDAADTNTHTNIYKLGSVAGKGGYAVKFEWRVVWD